MEDKILEIMERVFSPEKVSPETSQTNCPKWDSLNHLNLIVELEDEVDMEFEPEEIAAMKSVKDIVKTIFDKQS